MLLIEMIDNALQLICLGVCTVLSVYQSYRSKNRIWTLMSMYYMVYTLGMLYWLLYMIFYGQTPYFSFIPDFCWLASYLFLLLSMLLIGDETKNHQSIRAFWFIPVFIFGMCLFYMTRGDYLTNITYAVMMTLLICYALKGMISLDKTSGSYDLHRSILFFCTVEYCLWTSSCLEGVSFADYLYYFFDIMLTLANVRLYLSARKAAKDELY